MAGEAGRFCVKECVKDGEVHKFTGAVRLVLEEPSPREEMLRRTGAAFIAAANLFMGANLGIVLVFSLSYKLPLFLSAHALFCTIATQLTMPHLVMILNPLNGPSALMNRDRRRCEHTVLSFMAVIMGTVAGVLPIFDKYSSARCWHHAHIYGGYTLFGTVIASLLSGFVIHLKSNELESPTIITSIHRAFGMLSTLLSGLTYIFSIYGEGGCNSTFRFWLHATGFEGPVYLMYFMIIFYTCVLLFLPGSKYIRRTKYNC